jgi:DNA-directed RNA polymerase specialized sigma subunit
MARNKKIIEPMNEVIDLLKKLLILELFKMNVSQAEIGKKLGIATITVNKMLKGVNKEVLTKANSKN